MWISCKILKKFSSSQLLHICAMDMDITKIVLNDKPGRGSLPWASAASAASISARRGGTSSLGVGGGWGAGLGGPRTLLPWPGTKRWKWIGWGLPSTSTKKGGGIRCGSVCVWNKTDDNLTKSPLKVCCKWSYRHPARFFNPLSPKSDQHQISPCNINTL